MKMICKKADCTHTRKCHHKTPHKKTPECDQGSCTQYSEGVECMQHKPIEFLGKDDMRLK